ncbi:MAG: restriction endonuclease subunit S [Candidatus Syntrophoarchaeum sp.]|nr:restriction endonuclease subunit S [Candidatus Syntrophoarchaeum sp.]
MGEWKECKLGDVSEIVGGGTPKTKVPEYWNGEIPWLTPRDLSNFSGRYISKGERNISKLGLANSSAKILPKGAILLSSRAPVGYLAIALDEMSTNQGFRSLIPNSKTNSLFLFYLLKNNVDYLKSQSTGTTFGELAGSTLKSLSFLFPPLPEQRAIASVLSSLDDKIDLLHRQNKTLEAMAETLFRQWFVEEAEEGWEEGCLPDEFDFTMGQSPPGDSYNEEGIGVPLFQGNADFGFRFPTNRVYTTDPKRFAEKYDTLISVRAPVGAQNMAFEKCCIGRGVAAFRYKYNNSFYTYTYFKLKSLMNEIKQYNETGTVFGSISKSDFQNLGMTIPSKEEVIKFQEIAKPIDAKIIKNNVQIRTLSKLRDTLLPKLMSGEVGVEYE